MFSCNKHEGYTLLEVLISMTLAIMVISAVSEVLVSTMTQSGKWDNTIALQHHALRLNALMSERIHHAGDIGCAKLSHGFPLLSYQAHELNGQNKLLVNAKSQLVVRGMIDKESVKLPIPKGSTSIITRPKSSFKPHEMMIITDCTHGELFEIKKVHRFSQSSVIETMLPLRLSYVKHATLGRFNEETYYIDKSSSTLVVNTKRGGVQKIMKNIDDLRFVLSVKQDGRHNHYSPDEVIRWENVDGIAMDIVMSKEKVKQVWHLFFAIQ